jgi:HD-like signal output (HDOD) protein
MKIEHPTGWEGMVMNIDRILKPIDNLPAFPATVGKVLRLTGDPDYSMDELVRVVELAQAVTTNVLMCATRRTSVFDIK